MRQILKNRSHADLILRETFSLSTTQTDFIKETEVQIYKLIDETPPNGKRFAKTVRHMLQREELWNNWKNEGCKGMCAILYSFLLNANLTSTLTRLLRV